MAAQRTSFSASEKARESQIEIVAGGMFSSNKTPTAGFSKKNGDAALELLGSSTTMVTPEQDTAVLRKIDRYVLPIMLMVYFLQQLDKSSLSYTSVFGIVQQTGLVGTQYSWLNSIVYVAQLVWQPVSSYLLVRLPVAKYLAFHVFMWGVIVASMSAAKDFKGLLVSRFFLGIFEATVAPSFITITTMWWRRREQTMRTSMWMGMNGVTGMVGSLLTFGLGHINGSLYEYQTIFLFIGCLTLACSPVVLLVLPDSPTKAKFLSREEKIIALERLRANNQGTESKVWKWNHVRELCLDLKTYLWFILLFVCAVPSGGIGAFAPLIIQGFGFNPFHTILFNIPFAAMQVIITLISGHVSTKIKLKWPIVFFLCLPPIAGASALYVLGRGPGMSGKLLACYYTLSFFTAIQPMLYTWSSQNTAGHTKKTCTTGLVFVAQCAGNIVGPLLFKTEDKPFYRPGLTGALICWIALACTTLFTAAYLAFLNKRHAAARVRLGKAAVVVDRSLEETKTGKKAGVVTGFEKAEEAVANDQAFDDLTDLKNEDFIYVL